MKKKMRVTISALLSLVLLFSCLTMAFAEPAEDVVRYLSDYTPTYVKVGYSSLYVDKGLDGTTLKTQLADGSMRTYEKGFCVHAESELRFNIDGKGVKRFQSYIGINYSTNNTDKDKSSCGFVVKADDTVLYTSPVVMKTKMDPLFVDVAIPENTSELVLITNNGGLNGITGDHSSWFDAKLVLDGAMQNNLSSLQVSSDRGILPLGSQATLSVAGTLVNGTVVSFQPEQVTYQVSDPAVLSVSAQGVVTGLSSGNASVTCTAQSNGVSKSIEVFFVVGEGDSVSSWVLSAPEEDIKTAFVLKDGVLTFLSDRQGEAVIGNSPTGLVTNLGDFRSGLTFVSAQREEVLDSYSLIGAKESLVNSRANQLTMQFSKGAVTYSVIARMYDDGLAFRYAITSTDGATLTISSENSAFQMPADSVAYAMAYVDHHEAVAYKTEIKDLAGNYCMPFLYQAPSGSWVLLSEAALSTAYCGAVINANSSGMAKVVFSPEQTTNVATTAPFVSPWRFAVIGDPSAIAENVMAENLSPDCAIEDTSWIRPGVTAWTWLNRESTSDFATYKRYIDFAAEMGWQYLLLDEGWQPKGASGSGFVYRGYYEWTQELLDYAEQKGVGLIAWLNHNDIKTPEKQDIVLTELAELGFVGIKPDFFNSQSQSYMMLYEQLMQKTAALKMMLNPHGANKTTGERRTYPNCVSREGIFGAEQDLFRPTQVGAWNNCTLPFTRAAVGPSDYTPMFSYRNAGSRRPYTMAHQAALTVIYESALQCLADRPAAYLDSPARAFFQALPTNWTTSRLVDGVPGDYVNMARQHGDDWYLGIICNAQRTAQFDLDFLGEGTYYAFIYKDGVTLNDIDVEMKAVTRDDSLTIPMLETGGAAVKILKELPSQPESIRLNTPSQLALNRGESLTITATLQPVESELDSVYWTSSNPAVATVANGVVTALSPGITTIVASTGFGGSIQASVRITVTESLLALDDNWTIRNNTPSYWEIHSENSMTITTQPGEFYTGTSNAQNVFFTDAPQGDFTVTTKLSFAAEGNYQTAGLLVYAADNILFGAVRRSHSSFGGNIFATFSMAPSFTEQYLADANPTSPAYIKIVKSGATLTMFCSFDGETWTQVKNAVTNSGLNVSDLKIGLYAVGGNSGTHKDMPLPATFEDLTVYDAENPEGRVIPFAVRNSENVTVTAPESAVVGELFEVTVTTSADAQSLALVNENGRFVSIASLQKQVNGETITWKMTTAVGTIGDRTLSVRVKNSNGILVDSGENIRIIIQTEEAGILEAGFTAHTVAVNQITGATALGAYDSVKLRLTNENGRDIGKSIASRVRLSNGNIQWVIDAVSFGTKGDNRAITFSAANAEGVYGEKTVTDIINITA